MPLENQVMHHARYTKFGLLTPWLDTLFGTAWPDVAQTQPQAANRQPLATLNERCR